MATVAITINGSTWTALTSAGYSGICWMLIRPLTGRILLDHSSAGLGDIDEGKSYSIPDNKEVITDLSAVNDNDIFYAKCSEVGQYAVVIVDDERLPNSGISNNNSTSTPLGIGETFTGDWVDITKYGIIYVNIATDVDSAEDGLRIIQSSDGVNEDHIDAYSIIGGKHKNFSVNPHSDNLKVEYTNGSVAQTYFRLQVKFNADGLASSHRTKDDITTDDDARLVKSIQMIKANDQDEYKNIELNNPMPVNSGQLYQSDINIEYSNMYNFSGSPIDISKDRWTPIVDNTANNPKYLLLEFERPIQTAIVGITTEQGNFSNTVIKYGLTTSPSFTLIDESADSTLKTLLIAPSTPITLTRLEFEFHTSNPVTLTGINLGKSNNTIAQIQGIDPDGELLTVGTSRIGNLNVSVQEYGDTPSIDAFDRLRVSEPYTIFDSKQLYDKQPLFYDERLGGSATSTHSTINAAVTMAVTASASDYAIRQTKQRFNYQPGKGQMILMTFHAEEETGVTKRIGLFDGTGTNFLTPNNGVFLEINGTDISWNIAKNGSTTETIDRADWNYDKLDGEGPSGLTLDINGTEIAIIDFEWLGVGRVRVGFVIGGLIRYVHYFNHSNQSIFTSVYMSTPNLPIRYDIQSDGTGAGTIDHICSTIMSEGGLEETGISRSIDTENVHVDANLADTPYVILGLRLKTTHLDLTILPEYISMISETNDDFRWSLLLNPTFNGALTWSDISNSGCQWSRGATANDITSQGTKLDSGYSKSASSIDRRITTSLRIGSNIDLTRDILILAGTPLASNADLQASLTFRELL